MEVQQIADRLVELCRQGNWSQAHQELYSTNAVSIEPEGAPMVRAEGMEAITQKGEHFNSMVDEYLGVEVSDPQVAGDYFSCKLVMDVKFKGAPGPTKMEEIALYTTNNGKIVQEQFFYNQEPAG